MSKNKIQIIIAAKDQASKILGQIKGKLASFGGGVVKAVAGIVAAATAAAAALGALVKSVLDRNDDLAKAADKLGLTTQALSAFRHAADLSGIGAKELETGLQFMLRGIADAAKGTGQAKEAFEAMGLSIEELRKAGPEKAMEMIIGRLEGVKDATDRVEMAMSIFGRSGASMLNLTAKALSEAKKEAEQFGLAINRADAGKMEEINDNVTRLKSSWTGATNIFTAKLLPLLGRFSDKVAEFAKSGNLQSWAEKAGVAVVDLSKTIISTIPRALLLVYDVAGKVGVAFSGWKLIINGLTQLWAAFQLVLWEGLNTFRQKTTEIIELLNVDGIFDDALRDSKRIESEQAVIIEHLEAQLHGAVEAQKDLLRAQKDQEKATEAYRKKIENLQGDFDSFVGTIDDAIASQQKFGSATTTKAVQEVDKYTAAVKRAKEELAPSGPGKKESEIERMLREWKEVEDPYLEWTRKQNWTSFTPGTMDLGGRTDFRGVDLGDLKKQSEALNTVADSQKVAAENAERHAKAVQLSAEYMGNLQKASESGDGAAASAQAYDALANSLARVASMSALAAQNLMKLGDAQARREGTANDGGISALENALKLAERTGG